MYVYYCAEGEGNMLDKHMWYTCMCVSSCVCVCVCVCVCMFITMQLSLDIVAIGDY